MAVKKVLSILILGLTLVGCGTAEEITDESLTVQDELLDQIIKKEIQFNAYSSNESSIEQVPLSDSLEDVSLQELQILDEQEKNEHVDAGNSKLLDLTNLNPTMLYAQVYEMIYNHAEYNGQKIKLNGLYQEFSYQDEEGVYITNRRIMIPDAAACCETGMELQWEVLPDYFPSFDEEIQIVGTYETYVEGYVLHCIIHVENMVIL